MKNIESRVLLKRATKLLISIYSLDISIPHELVSLPIQSRNVQAEKNYLHKGFVFKCFLKK